MASVTDTATAEPSEVPPPVEPAIAAPVREERPAGRVGERVRGWRRRISPLTRRIIAVNLLPLALLAVGFLYLG